MTLDKKLSRLRKKEGLSQAEVAERLDLSRQAVSRWESGEAKPSTDNFQALCKLYHVSMDYLLNESEDELPAPAPAPATESRPKRDTQRKEKRWIRWIVIGVAVLVLLVCFLFWDGSRQKEDVLDLHSIQGEDSAFPEEPDFYLNLQ